MNEEQRAKSADALVQWSDDSGIDRSALERIFEGLKGSGGGGAPLQNPAFLCPGLEARPWHDPDRFPWAKVLERAYPDIRRELLEESAAMSEHPESGMLAASGRWTTYHFFNMGRRYEEHHDRCPVTSRALQQVPGIASAGMAYFSRMAPATEVKPHCGFTNTRIRAHLGLVVPQDCAMRVGQETRSWQEGKVLVFDDSFEHAVRNDADSWRAVLLLDTWHPDLSEDECRALSFLMTLWKSYLG